MSVLEAGIKRGQLLIEDHEGKHVFGEADCNRPVTMTIRCDDVWARIVLSLDMGRGFLDLLAPLARVDTSPNSVRSIHERGLRCFKLEGYVRCTLWCLRVFRFWC